MFLANMYISILTCSTSFTVYFGVTQVMFFSVFFGWGISNTVDHRLLFLFGWEILVKLQYSVIFLLSINSCKSFPNRMRLCFLLSFKLCKWSFIAFISIMLISFFYKCMSLPTYLGYQSTLLSCWNIY